VDQPDLQAKGVVEARQVEVTRWAGVHRTSRHHLEGLSLTRHPFRLSDAVPQPAAQGARQRTAAVEAIAAFAQSHQLPVRHDIMQKVRPQVPARAALVDFWWEGVRQDVEQATIALPWRPWARESLLPWVYGEHQMAHTRCARRQATIRRAWEAGGAALRTHEITRRLPAQALEDWHAWATQQVQAFQRASSAVEGRNGALAQRHPNQRG
jgi:hypothetical protein